VNWPAAASVLSACLTIVVACSSSPRLPDVIAEPSGAVASRIHRGVLWVHGDSGTSAAVFAVRDEQILARVELKGVENVDWEDIAVQPGLLWIGDVGNNAQTREDLRVHLIREPDPARGSTTVVPERTIQFRYPDRDETPNWDAESLFVHDERLWLLTKHRADTKTTLYVFPPGDDVVLERVSEFDLGGSAFRFGGRASGATTSPDGRYLAVLSYHALFLFDLVGDPPHPLAKLVHRVELETATLRQCEAVAWTDSGLVIINEAGRVFRIADPLDTSRTRFPQ
jgi:hypothetical protein